MRVALSVLIGGILLLPVPARAGEVVQQITLSTHLHSRTSLQVSSHVLVFAVTTDDGTATASIDYVAAARTHRDGEVVLSVERLGSIEGPGGAADVETELSLSSDGGTGMPLRAATLASAARWIGSGSRAGELTFALRASAAGTYVVPMRLVLSAP